MGGERSWREAGKKLKKVAMGLCWDNLAYLMGGNLGCDFFMSSRCCAPTYGQ